VPNGELTAFSHHTAAWSRPIVEVGIDHDQDARRALAVLAAVGREFQGAHPGEVLEPPVAEGILKLEESRVGLRLHARVDAIQKFPLELELRRRVKEAFDAEGIRMPAGRMVVRIAPDDRPAAPAAGRKESPA
jgi:small conductance mechanosensitive channel